MYMKWFVIEHIRQARAISLLQTFIARSHACVRNMTIRFTSHSRTTNTVSAHTHAHMHTHTAYCQLIALIGTLAPPVECQRYTPKEYIKHHSANTVPVGSDGVRMVPSQYFQTLSVCQHPRPCAQNVLPFSKSCLEPPSWPYSSLMGAPNTRP